MSVRAGPLFWRIFAVNAGLLTLIAILLIATPVTISAPIKLAQALVHDPQNVVLDEPTGGLDVASTRALRRFLENLAEAGRCVLFSSHIMQEVAALTDRIVIMARGRVVAAGTHEEILASTGRTTLEDAFLTAIGSAEGLLE